MPEKNDRRIISESNPVKIISLLNPHHFFLVKVLIIILGEKDYRLLVLFNNNNRNTITYYKKYDSPTGAKVAFSKLYSWKAFEGSSDEFHPIETSWSHRYPPERKWLYRILSSPLDPGASMVSNIFSDEFKRNIENIFRNIERIEKNILLIHHPDIRRTFQVTLIQIKTIVSGIFFFDVLSNNLLADTKIKLDSFLEDTMRMVESIDKKSKIYKDILNLPRHLSILSKHLENAGNPDIYFSKEIK